MWVLKMIWDILAAFAFCFWANVFFLYFVNGSDLGTLNTDLVYIGTALVFLVKLQLSGWYLDD